MLIFLVVNQNAKSDQSENIAELTWKIVPVLETKNSSPSSLIAEPNVEYYWNGISVGNRSEGLAVLYEKIKRFEGNKIIIHSRSFDGSGPVIDGLLEENIWKKFNQLLRTKNMEVSIIYSHDKKDIIKPRSENPFRVRVEN
jgi:hypothetical protein